MKERFMDSGIEQIEKIPFGTHICLFFNDKKDITDVVVPFMVEGLKNHQLCMWVVYETVTKKEALAALRVAMPDIDTRLEMGQFILVKGEEWVAKLAVEGGSLTPDSIMATWKDIIRKAREAGFEGLRATGSLTWLPRQFWDDLTQCEDEADKELKQEPVIALCQYHLPKVKPAELIKISRSHDYTLIKNDDKWECIARTH
jgi:hypothetical protein